MLPFPRRHQGPPWDGVARGTGKHENGRRRRRIEPTDEWEHVELLCGWPEQRDYELIRPLVLFGGPAAERAEQTGAASERTLQRRVARFDSEGMESLFGSEHAGRKRLQKKGSRGRGFAGCGTDPASGT